ncbi:MAG: DUF1553 domain-containing protein, partial [Pirellulaceae bacterium]
PPATHVLLRGNPHAPGDPVEPGFLSVLTDASPEIPQLADDLPSSGRRLALARWLASPKNPLTSRVLANRIWQHHFGRGIVRSSSDFGFQGTAPTHPELLDWLASDLVDGGWRMKRLHKQIMMSRAYQMSSGSVPDGLAKDPENNLFWRFNPRRLSAEEIRDSILAVNGSLNQDKMFGPSIYVKIPADVLAGQSRPGDGWGQSSTSDAHRRSVYIHVKRSLAPPILTSFDAADTDNSCPVRFTTTQPTQALGMLNSDFLHAAAETFATYLRRQGGSDVATQVGTGLRRVLQREPSEREIERGVEFIRSLQHRHELTDEVALRMFCLAALNLNEFVYLD